MILQELEQSFLKVDPSLFLAGYANLCYVIFHLIALRLSRIESLILLLSLLLLLEFVCVCVSVCECNYSHLRIFV